MVTMVSTIANGGTYVQPRIVKGTIDSKTKERKEVEIIKKDRVISEETAQNVLSMMESVVAEGTGKNSQVKGYRIGGKTGTSEDGVNTGKYVTSFIGVAPISDPSVAVLITLYNPTGEGGHQGGVWFILSLHEIAVWTNVNYGYLMQLLATAFIKILFKKIYNLGVWETIESKRK